jgi:hypothetical protein
MIDRDPSNLLREIRFAERVRDRYLSTMREIVGRIHGRDYRGRHASDATCLEPHGYEYSSLMLGRLAINAPRWRTLSGGGSLGDIARIVRANMNQWGRQARLKRVCTLLAQDALVNVGFNLTTFEPRRGYEHRHNKGEEVPMMPFWKRIPQNRMLLDPLCTDFYDDCRYKGHTTVMTKEALLAKARRPGEGWKLDAINALAADSNADKARGWNSGEVKRDEIAFHELWVPEIVLDGEPGPDEFFHGTVFTIAEAPGAGGKEGEGIELRAPRAWYGPRRGGYSMFGIYPVINEPWPLAPLQAVNAQVQNLNDQLRAASESARQYKRMLLVDSSLGKAADAIINSPHDYVVKVEGLSTANGIGVEVVEVGGVSDQQIKQILMDRGILDRVSSMGDAQKGFAGDGTATAEAIADQSQSVRVGFIKSQFADSITESGQCAAEYMWNDPRYEAAMDPESIRELGIQTTPGHTPKFRGGQKVEGEDPIDLEDLGIALEPMSMGLTTEAEEFARVMQAIGVAMELGSIAPEVPWMDIKRLLGAAGDAANYEGLEETVDVDMARQLSGGMQGFAPQMKTMREARGVAGTSSGGGGGRRGGGFRGAQPRGAGQLGGAFARQGLGSLGSFKSGTGGGGGMGPARQVQGNRSGAMTRR